MDIKDLLKSKTELMDAVKADGKLSEAHRELLSYGIDQKFEALSMLSKIGEAEKEVGETLLAFDKAIFMGMTRNDFNELQTLAYEYGTTPFYNGEVCNMPPQEIFELAQLVFENDKQDREQLNQMIDELPDIDMNGLF